LAVTVGKVSEAVGVDITYFIFWVYKVVAAVYIAVMLYCKSTATGLAE
jgi:hypothetical protein